MASIELYRASINRKHKPRTKALLNNIVNSVISDYVLRADGCDITNTSSYIDVEISSGTDWANRLYECNYIRIVNQTTQTYFAYLDRVEPNNFNDLDTHSYRLFFTIDWWCTLLYRLDDDKFEEMLQSIDGSIVRTHVNDCKKVNNSWKPCIDYTTLEMEKPIPRFDVSEYSAYTTGTYYKKKFLYLLSTKSGSDYQKGCAYHLGVKDYATSLNVFVLPIDFTARATYIIHVLDGQDTIINKTKTIGSVTPEVIDAITDTSIVAMYISEFCPAYDYTTNSFSSDIYVASNEDFNFVEFNNISFYQLFEINQFDVKISDVIKNLYLWTNIRDYSKPTSYGDYYNDCIVKSTSYPYCYFEAILGNDKLCIDNFHLNSDTICSFNIDPYGTGYYLYSDTSLKTGECAYSMMKSFGSYPPISKQDWITRLNSYASTISAISGVASGGVSGAISGASFGGVVGGIAGGAFGLAQGLASQTSTLTTAYRSIRDGESGTKIGASPSANFFDMLRFRSTRIPDEHLSTVREDLAIYGYTTSLRPIIVLKYHKRNFYNYIKIAQTNINYPILCTEARLAIEEMFNNGVWLWNKITATSNDCYDGVGRNNAMGYLYLNNYPIILDN